MYEQNTWKYNQIWIYEQCKIIIYRLCYELNPLVIIWWCLFFYKISIHPFVYYTLTIMSNKETFLQYFLCAKQFLELGSNMIPVTKKVTFLIHIMSLMTCFTILNYFPSIFSGDKITSIHSQKSYEVQEIGIMHPDETPLKQLWVLNDLSYISI